MSESPPEPTLIGAARAALKAALGAVDEIRVYTDPGAKIDPPAAVVSLPDLRWENYQAPPTAAVFSIALIVKANDHAVDELARLVPEVAAAIETVDNAAVLTARVGAWRDQLPAYLIEVEYAL